MGSGFLKPKSITFEQAAAVPTSGLIVLANLQNERKIKSGQSILINGAGGGVGSIALQLAKSLGATVTAIDTTKKLEMLRSLGADFVIDYTKQDFTTLNIKYDLIFDVASNLKFADCKKVLTPKGIFVLIDHDHFGTSRTHVFGMIPRMLKLVALAPFETALKGINFSQPPKKESMDLLTQMLASGKITPVIDKVFPLNKVPLALQYLASGMACGRILINTKESS